MQKKPVSIGINDAPIKAEKIVDGIFHSAMQMIPAWFQKLFPDSAFTGGDSFGKIRNYMHFELRPCKLLQGTDAQFGICGRSMFFPAANL